MREARFYLFQYRTENNEREIERLLLFTENRRKATKRRWVIGFPPFCSAPIYVVENTEYEVCFAGFRLPFFLFSNRAIHAFLFSFSYLSLILYHRVSSLHGTESIH